MRKAYAQQFPVTLSRYVHYTFTMCKKKHLQSTMESLLSYTNFPPTFVTGPTQLHSRLQRYQGRPELFAVGEILVRPQKFPVLYIYQ